MFGEGICEGMAQVDAISDEMWRNFSFVNGSTMQSCAHISVRVGMERVKELLFRWNVCLALSFNVFV